MPDFDLTRQLAADASEGFGTALRSIAARLAAMEIAVERFGLQPNHRPAPMGVFGGSYWACRSVSDSDLTLTEANSEDWDAMIGDSELSGYLYDVPTESGWLHLPDDSSDHHRSAAITFHNGGAPYSAPALLVSSQPGSDQYVQVSVNGEIEEITVDASPFVHPFEIEVKEGENRIVVSCKSGCGGVELRTRFMDGSYGSWTDPSGE